MTTFYALPDAGQPVTLYTHLLTREDAQLPYGFSDLRQRDLFRNLLRVNGVGAKLALTILSGMDAGAFAAWIEAGDTAALVRLPGVGKKTAERLVIEMRDRLAAEGGVPAAAAATGSGSPPASPTEDAVTALIGLGYKPQEASRMVRGLDTRDLSSEEIIRTALQATVQ